jgi:Poly(3-hydroxybutyrate) depolymerase
MFLVALGIALAKPTQAQETVMTWDVDGVKREALVFVPTMKAGAKVPVVFAFHGHGGNMQGFSRMARLQQLWPEAIVVYPQGLPSPTPRDTAGLRPGWQFEAGQSGDRDLKFIDTMLESLKKTYGVDEKRIYSTGFSNGAGFSYLLWAKRAKDFAAFGICAGATPEKISEAKPAIIIAGQSDKVLPFATQQEALVAARLVDQANGIGQSCGPFCTLYPSTVKTPVKTIIHPGGHLFMPGMAQEIVAFFKANPSS